MLEIFWAPVPTCLGRSAPNLAVYSVAPEKRKKNNFTVFQHLISVVETKLDAGAHLQIFPYPTIPRSFPTSNELMVKRAK